MVEAQLNVFCWHLLLTIYNCDHQEDVWDVFACFDQYDFVFANRQRLWLSLETPTDIVDIY